MKTTNWQAKALTLFIAALALWLTAACTENSDAPIYESDVPVHHVKGGAKMYQRGGVKVYHLGAIGQQNVIS